MGHSTRRFLVTKNSQKDKLPSLFRLLQHRGGSEHVLSGGRIPGGSRSNTSTYNLAVKRECIEVTEKDSIDGGG